MKGIEGGSGHPSQKRNPFFLKGNKQTNKNPVEFICNKENIFKFLRHTTRLTCLKK